MSIALVFVLIFSLKTTVFSHPKGDFLRNLTLLSPTGVIQLDPELLDLYVLSHPRPYDIVLFITGEKQGRIIKSLYNEYEKVSESFKEQEAYKPNKNNRKRAVFFTSFKLKKNTQNYSRLLNFRSDVSISYTTPYHISEERVSRITYSKDHNLDYKENTEHTMPLLEFMNKNSQRGIELKKDPILTLIYFFTFIWALILGGSLFIKYKNVILNPLTWHICSCLIFIACIGGTVWNFLNGAHLVKFDEDWTILEYVNRAQRKQYIGEGLFMSIMFICIGNLLGLLTRLNKIEGWLIRKVLGILMLALIFILNYLVIYVYRIKAPWYSPTLNPPKEYMKGGLIKDQGNSF